MSFTNKSVPSVPRPTTLARRLIIPVQTQLQSNISGPKNSLPRRPTGHRSRLRGRAIFSSDSHPHSHHPRSTKPIQRSHRIIQQHPLLPSKSEIKGVPKIERSSATHATQHATHTTHKTSSSDNVLKEDYGYSYCLVVDFYTLIPTTREIASKKNHVRISNSGVLRIFKDPWRSKEFTEIDRWRKEAKWYSAMQKFHFFKVGLLRRVFQNWAYIVRRTKFTAAGLYITKHWFPLHSVLSEPLHQMWKLRLKYIHATQTSFYTFESLRELMSTVNPGQSSIHQLRQHLLNDEASGIQAIHSFVVESQSLVHNTLLHILSKGLGKNISSGRQSPGLTRGRQRKIYKQANNSNKHGKDNNAFHAEGNEDEQEVQEGAGVLKNYNLPRRLIHELRRFIRLVDCIAASTLIRGCIEKQQVVNMLLHKGRHDIDNQEPIRREYLLQIQVHTNLERRFVSKNIANTTTTTTTTTTTKQTNNVKLEPSLTLVHALLKEIEQHYLSYVVNVQRLNGQIDLEKTLRQVRASAKKNVYEHRTVSLSDIVVSGETKESNNERLVRPVSVEKHPEWISWCRNNRDTVQANFYALLKNSDSIAEKLLSIGTRENKHLPSVVELQQKIRSGLCPVDDISAVVETLTIHRKELQRVKVNVHQGPLTASLKFVRECELKRTKSELKALSQTLPLLLERLCLGVRDEVMDLQSRIDQDAETLEGASAMVSISMDISSHIDSLKDREQQAQTLNKLLENLNLRLSKETAACLPTLGALLDQLQASNYGLMSRKEDTIARWRLHISERVKELQSETQDLRKQLTVEDSFICDPSTEPQDALVALELSLSSAKQFCNEGTVLLNAEKIFADASPEDLRKLRHLHHSQRITLLQEAEKCCLLLISTCDMVQLLVELNTLTLKLRKEVRIVSEFTAITAIDGDNENGNLSLLCSTSQQLSKVTTSLLDSMGTRTSDLCHSRLNEARDTESVTQTIDKLRLAVHGHLSVDHREDIVDILYSDKPSFRPAIAAAGNLKGLGWIRVKDFYNITVAKRNAIAFIIHVSESEAALRAKFILLKKEWSQMCLTFGNWNGTMSTLELTEDFVQYLENTTVAISTLMSNPYSTNIRDDIEDFSEEALIVQDTTTEWIQIQLTFQRLVQVFDSASVKLQLKKEFQILRRATLDWEELFVVKFDQSILETLAGASFQNQFNHISVSLETVSHGVTKYLEIRRLSFPRFFFLHDEELTEVLEHSLKMHNHFETHVHRCFPGIRSGVFDRSDRKKPVLVNIQSTSNERLVFTKPVSEGIDFLPSLARQIGITLRSIFRNTKKALSIGGGNLEIRSLEIINKDIPVHILLGFVQCEWYMTVDHLLRSLDEKNQPLANLLNTKTEKNTKSSAKLAVQLRSSGFTDGFGDEDEFNRQERTNALTRVEEILMHDLCARDRAQSLISKEVESVDHSDWIMSSKMSLTRGEGIMLNVGNVRIDYAFEYVGAEGMGASQLVLSHTVLRCMWAIAHATQMLNCCALVHSNSQGQLNLIQGMAAVCAIFTPLVSFSIDSHHEHIIRVIKGVCACSCWLRLSNLSNLDIISSAVLSQSISSLILAVQRGLKQITFAGVEVPILLKTTLVGFECSGYDFARFPSHLRSIFHATGIVAADPLRIAELLLMSKGVNNSAVLIGRIQSAVICSTNNTWNNVTTAATIDCFRKSTVLDIVNKAIIKVHESKSKLNLEYLINNVIKSMISVQTKNKYDATLCTPGERFLINKNLKSAKLGHLLYAEKGVVELHCALNLWGVVAVVGERGSGKTSIRRVLLQSRGDIHAGVRTGGRRGRKRLRRGAARVSSKRASVSLPKGRRSSLISPKRVDMRGSTRYIFPETLTFDELFGTTNKTGWVEGVVGHLIKSMNNERTEQIAMQELKIEKKPTLPQYIVVDGCHRSPVIDLLINMCKNNILDLPNGESISIKQLFLQVMFEVKSLHWLSPGHISSMGVVNIGGTVDLPVVFFNLCHKMSEGSMITTFQQKIISALQNLCIEITEIDILGCTDHPAQLIPCTMAATRVVESIICICYAKGSDSFAGGTSPSVDIIAKAVLCYALLWVRNAYVEDLPAEPKAGLLPEWLDDVSADLPLVVRRMEPRLMLATSGYLLLENEVDVIPPVLESEGLISFSHLPGARGGAFLLSVLAKSGMHVALTGPSRVGKTAIARATTAAISTLEDKGYNAAAWYAFHCQHNQFNPHSIGSAIAECFSTTYGNVFAGIGGKRRVIIVIDDVAATKPHEIDDHKSHDRASTFELNGIRSLVCEQGYHDISTLLWQRVSLFNIVVTSQCRPSSNFAVDNHHFCTVQLDPLSSMGIQQMYCHVLGSRCFGGGSGGDEGTAPQPTAVTELIEPLVKATISTAAIYKMTRAASLIPPVHFDSMFLDLFPMLLKPVSPLVSVKTVKVNGSTGMLEDLEDSNTSKTTKIRQWFHHARAVFGDQCSTLNAATDLADTLMSNLHAALSIHGQAVESKSRRISVVNTDLSSYSNTQATAVSALISSKAAADASPVKTFTPTQPTNNTEFGECFIAAGSDEHIEIFQAMLSILKTTHAHVAVVSNDVMLGTGLVKLAMAQMSCKIVVLRVGPVLKSHGKKAARKVLLGALSDAADSIHQENAKVGLIVENADDLPLSMASLLSAIATKTYPGGYFTPSEKKRLTQKAHNGVEDVGSDSCWAKTFTRITSQIKLTIVMKGISKLKHKIHLGCSVLGLLKLSKTSHRKVVLATMQNYKGIVLTHEVQNKLCNLFISLEQKMDDFGVVRSDCMFLQNIIDYLKMLTQYNTRVRAQIEKYEIALRFQAVAHERSALLNAEGIALNWRMVLLNRKITHLASQVNKTQQLYGIKSRKLFSADKDATVVKSTVSKLTQEIDKNLLKSNSTLAQARGIMRGINHADVMRLLKEEELPRVVFRLGTAASSMLGNDIIENDEEELRDFLADPMLLAKLVRFDPQRGPSKSMLMAARQTQSQPYSKDQVQKFGAAALALREWVHATSAKIAVLSDIHPLYLQLDHAKLALTARNEALNSAFAAKQQCSEQLESWQTAYDAATHERTRIQEKVALRLEKMKIARECARSVVTHVETWRKELKELRVSLATMLGDVWIGAACLRYAALLAPGRRYQLFESMHHSVRQQNMALSPGAAFGCPSPGAKAEINACMLCSEHHAGIYMLDQVCLPQVAVLIDPDRLACDFLKTTMKHDDGFERSFDGDLKFAGKLQFAQLNRSTLLVERLSDAAMSSVLWDTINNKQKLMQFQEHYPGFQLVLSCDALPSWIKHRGMTHFVVIDFSRPKSTEDATKDHGEEVYLKLMDKLSEGSIKHERQLLLVNIAQDLSDYNDAVDKLLSLVGADFEQLIVDKQTTRRINEAALNLELLKQRTDSASDKLQRSKDAQRVVEHTANLILELIEVMNCVIERSKDAKMPVLQSLDFVDAIFDVIRDTQEPDVVASASLDHCDLPSLEVIATAVMYTFVANCFHRGMRTRLAFAAFMFVLTRSSQKYYNTMVDLFQIVEKAKVDTGTQCDSMREYDEESQTNVSKRKKVIVVEQKLPSKLVKAFELLKTYLTRKWDCKTDACVHDIDVMLSWSEQHHGLASSVFGVIEAVLGTHETNVLVGSVYPHPHLIRKFLLSLSALQPAQYIIAEANHIQGTELFLQKMLSSFTAQKSLYLKPVSALSVATTRQLRVVINNGGFALCSTMFEAHTTLYNCLSLGYSADWIVRHLVLHVERLLGPASHTNDMSGGSEEDLKRLKRNKNKVHKRRLQSTTKLMMKGARLSSLMGLPRRGSKLSTTSKTSGQGRRGSLRGSIRNSFVHLDAKKEDDALEMLKTSHFRCCTTKKKNNGTMKGPFVLLSGFALAQHAVESQYALLTRKRKYSQSKIVSLAWQTYMHLVHATDLDMRVRRHANDVCVHLNQLGVLSEIESILELMFRHVMSGNEGQILLAMFFNEEFVRCVLDCLVQFYCHDMDAVKIYTDTFHAHLKSVWTENVVKEGMLGRFTFGENLEADSLLDTIYYSLEAVST